MFTAMAPLPVRPEFPVYGLSESFTGFRWLLLWQRRGGPYDGDITEVQLAHGHPDVGAFVVIRTVLKQAERDLPGGASIGETGLQYTASNAILHALESGPLDRDRVAALTYQELARLDESGGAEITFIGWRSVPVSIDGTVYPAQTRELDGSRASVVDRPMLAIGCSGPTESTAKHWELADVSGHLGDYVAGRGATADQLLT